MQGPVGDFGTVPLKVVVTGSSGLIGAALCNRLQYQGIQVIKFDIRAEGDDFGDVRDQDALLCAVNGSDGVVHLAAMSRVIHGEMDPDLCWDVNVNGITNVLDAILQQPERPWLIFSSSREVYGNAPKLPVDESYPLSPINLYGETKVKSELLIREAIATQGLQAAILRFSNVFGGLNDYPDRVIPAFIHAALLDENLRVDGAESTFDFTCLEDVVNGILMTISHLTSTGKHLEPVHLVTGHPTTLQELAETIIHLTESHSRIDVVPPRDYDVARFFGCPARAREVLGWEHKTILNAGLQRLIEANLLKFVNDLK